MTLFRTIGGRPAGNGAAASLLILLAAFLSVSPVRAQSESAGTPDPSGESESTATANPLDVDLLLEDPVRDLPPFQSIRDRLRQLAMGERSPASFESVAEGLAADGVYTAAIQVLWFASKMSVGEAGADEYARRMRVWNKAASAADELIEQGEQLQIAGRSREAIEAYLRAIESAPFNERAHFRLADAWRRVYRDEYGDQPNPAPLEIRVRLFRDAYVHFRLALELDPLFYDARYGLSELRDLFPDNRQVLLETQPFTQQALDFRAEVLPVLDEIEKGEESADTFNRLAEGLETIGASEYSVFAWQCALELGAPREEIAPRIEGILSNFESGAATVPGESR